VFEVGRLAVSTGLASMRASGDTHGDRVHIFTFQYLRLAHEIILPEPENVANLKQYNDTVGLQRPWRLADSGWRLGRRKLED
jgi:hypothetical protein